jgi:hypothetical protein
VVAEQSRVVRHALLVDDVPSSGAAHASLFDAMPQTKTVFAHPIMDETASVNDELLIEFLRERIRGRVLKHLVAHPAL